jgi:hypothetical protein
MDLGLIAAAVMLGAAVREGAGLVLESWRWRHAPALPIDPGRILVTDRQMDQLVKDAPPGMAGLPVLQSLDGRVWPPGERPWLIPVESISREEFAKRYAAAGDPPPEEPEIRRIP